MELIFEIGDAEEAGYCARALVQAIFTGGGHVEDLRNDVLEVALRFEDSDVRPRMVQLH